MSVPLRVLGVDIRVEVTGEDADTVRAEFASAWSACVETSVQEAIPYRVHLTKDKDNDAIPDGARVFRDRRVLMDSTTSGITQLVIDARSRDLLMLHACGLADESGRVAACVAASGTGKTTLASAGADIFRYVTDETVGIEADTSIVVYPKPLSVKRGTPGPKEQIAPQSLGLRAWGAREAPPRLRRIILLDRRTEPQPPVLEQVGELDAITELIPQISYLPRLDAPLQRLAGVIGATGGVVRAIYSEGTELLPMISDLLTEEADGLPPAHLLDPETVQARSQWSATIVEPRSTLRYRARAADDWLVRGGECLVLHEQTVYRLSAIGGAILSMTSHDEVTLDEMTDALVAIFGSPPDADPRTLAREALVALITAGLVDEFARSDLSIG